MRRGLLTAGAVVLAGAGAVVVAQRVPPFAASSTSRTSAGVTFSNRLLPAKDGRVIVSTLVPKPVWRGGQSWIITIQHSATQVESLVVRNTRAGNVSYADTVVRPFPTCVPYRVTVKPDTVLTATGRVSTKRDSLTAKLSLCRPYTPVELAFVDSFPGAGWRIVFCGPWAYREPLDSLRAARMEDIRMVPAGRTRDSAIAAIAADVAWVATQPESIPVTPRTWGQADTGHMKLGYFYPTGVLAKNRHTGTVRVLRSPALLLPASSADVTGRAPATCLAEAAAYQAAAEGRAP